MHGDSPSPIRLLDMLGIHPKDGLEERLAVCGTTKLIQVSGVLGQTADSGKEFDVLSLSSRGGEKNEEDVHRVRIRRAELNWGGCGRHKEKGFWETWNGGMGDGNAVSETGGMRFLPGRQGLDGSPPGRKVTPLLEEGAKSLYGLQSIQGLQIGEDQVVR